MPANRNDWMASVFLHCIKRFLMSWVVRKKKERKNFIKENLYVSCTPLRPNFQNPTVIWAVSDELADELFWPSNELVCCCVSCCCCGCCCGWRCLFNRSCSDGPNRRGLIGIGGTKYGIPDDSIGSGWYCVTIGNASFWIENCGFEFWRGPTRPVPIAFVDWTECWS